MTHGKALIHYGLVHRTGTHGRVESAGRYRLSHWLIVLALAMIAMGWVTEIRHDLPAMLALLHLHF